MYNSYNTLFTVKPSPFAASCLKVDESETYSDGVFDFTLSITVPFYKGDYIDVILPPEVDIPFSNNGKVLVEAFAPLIADTSRPGH
jgi:hypothetical protein